jgi:micrococcal nuclease
VITRVIDGDTFVCTGDIHVRLLLIDTPERQQGDIGAVASAALRRLAPVGSTVRLEFDVQSRDRYGRLLAYAYDSTGRMINEQLVREGVAVVGVYPPNVRYVDRFRLVADSARVARRGLWARDAFECSPADFRRGRCR